VKRGRNVEVRPGGPTTNILLTERRWTVSEIRGQLAKNEKNTKVFRHSYVGHRQLQL